MAAPNVTYHDHTAEDCRHMAREEKIFIYHSAQIPDSTEPKFWRVSEPLKPVYRGQTVIWQVVNDSANSKFKSNKLELDLPADVFQPASVNAAGTSVRVEDKLLKISATGKPVSVEVTVRDDIDGELHFYQAKVDDQPVVGGSSPGVIVDPAR